MRVLVMDTVMVRNNEEVQLSPVSHDELTGLNSLAVLRFFADVAIVEAGPYPLS